MSRSKSDSPTGQLLIFLEGSYDERFIEDVCEYHQINSSAIIRLEGKGNWKKGLHAAAISMNRNSDQLGRNIVLLDSDRDPIEDLEKQFNRECDKHGIRAELFCLPDHRSSGDMETLLREITAASKAYFWECWDEYLSCISNQDPSFDLPDKKTSIYAFLLGVSPDKKNIHAATRSYLNPEIWDLHHPSLQPLVSFLKGE